MMPPTARDFVPPSGWSARKGFLLQEWLREGLSALSGHRYPAWQQMSRNPFACNALRGVCDSAKDGWPRSDIGDTSRHLIYGLQTCMSVRDGVRVSSKMSDICVPIMH